MQQRATTNAMRRGACDDPCASARPFEADGSITAAAGAAQCGGAARAHVRAMCCAHARAQARADEMRGGTPMQADELRQRVELSLAHADALRWRRKAEIAGTSARITQGSMVRVQQARTARRARAQSQIARRAPHRRARTHAQAGRPVQVLRRLMVSAEELEARVVWAEEHNLIDKGKFDRFVFWWKTNVSGARARVCGRVPFTRGVCACTCVCVHGAVSA